MTKVTKSGVERCGSGHFALKSSQSNGKSLKFNGFEAFKWQLEAGGAALPVAEEAAAPAPQPRLWRAVAEQARERQCGKACSTAKKELDKSPKACIIALRLAGLCKGSTADSDSVCEGSNPSPAATKKPQIRWI